MAVAKNSGLPGTSGFVGELLSLIGLYNVNMYFAVIASTGMVLGAMYMLWLYKRVMLGKPNKEHAKTLAPLDIFETIYFVPLIMLVVVLGIYPVWLTGLTKSTILSLITNMKYFL